MDTPVEQEFEVWPPREGRWGYGIAHGPGVSEEDKASCVDWTAKMHYLSGKRFVAHIFYHGPQPGASERWSINKQVSEAVSAVLDE